LFSEILFALDFNDFASNSVYGFLGIYRFAVLASTQEDMGFIYCGFFDVDIEELFVGGNFKDFAAFGYHKGTELPEFFKHTVAVDYE
ncbi:MAG: hypothetical protein RSD04_06225, partial [Clostridia bacterium]